MLEINFEKIIKENYPNFIAKYPNFITNSIIWTIKKLFHQDEVNRYLQNFGMKKNDDFIDELFDYLNFTYKIDKISLENIPKTGRVIFVANHPLGGLDGLSVLRLISSVRTDVKILANVYLKKIEPIKDMFIGIDNLTNLNTKETLKSIITHIENEKAIIIFPAGEVSRTKNFKVQDGTWRDGFLKFAKKTRAPIVPIFIGGKNSPLFYLASMINRPLSGLLLGHELFNKRDKFINIKVGEMIPYENLNLGDFSNAEVANLMKKHIYSLKKDSKGIFKTQQILIKAQDPNALADEISRGEKLGFTRDNKGIYLCETKEYSPLLLELGRLRELTFRSVGEGTSRRYDIDKFDLYYKHLVLFDDEKREIIGAYRLGITDEIAPEINSEKLYTQTLFDYGAGSEFLFSNGVELGRSFVQPKFWGSRALDYLWIGIGAYVKKYPSTRYLFGPVSISVSYPRPARNLIVYFYKKYFSPKICAILSKNSYKFSADEKAKLDEIFCGETREQDFAILKNSLAFYGLSVPTLYKQYSDLCEDGGVSFHDFGVDADFNDCVDGFLVVDIKKLKPEKRARYFE